MSGPSRAQTSGDTAQNTLEEKQKEDFGADPINSVTVDPAGGGDRPPLLSSIRKDEAIVSRRELWSYYRQSSFFSFLCSTSSQNFFQSVLQRK